MYLTKNYIVHNAAALHNKNCTQKPFIIFSGSLAHIDLQPIWHSGKLFIERNFGDKKNIFLKRLLPKN
jgi:hypothetical protein